jgi:N-acetylmuramoyl-L-alanine amidase
MKMNSLYFLVMLCSYSTLFGQVALDTVVAQKGDGIFSILRKSGIHPVNYYVDFLELNKDAIKGASELVVGRKYILPDAPDSFKNMGTLIHVDENEETPIFDTELAGMKQRDSTLKNTVYHLLYPTIESEGEKKTSLDEFILKLSKDLIERGARVYVLQKNNMTFPVDTVAKEVERAIADFGELTSIVNKKYLKHNGSYQRVLMIRDLNRNRKGVSMAMHHYDNSVDGQHLAAAFRDIFKKNSLGKVKAEQGISPFTDAPNVYLAKNLLPSLTIMDINANAKGIQIRSSKSSLPELITKGILQDHATVNGSK